MTVGELEETYQRLRDQLLSGDLSEEGFRATVDLLQFEDELGNRWRIGWHTGKWYRFNQGQWIQGIPVEGAGQGARGDASAVSSAASRIRRRIPRTPCLVVALAGLLLAASLLLVFGWNADWWQTEPEGTADASKATQVEEVTAAPSAAATGTPTASPRPSHAPSRTATPRPTRTPRPRPPTSTPAQSSTSTPSADVPATRSATSTAQAQPSATPSLSGEIYFPVYDPNPERRTFDIWVVDLGSDEREILAKQASQPALSPSGERLVYRSWDVNSRGIYVRELADGHIWAWIPFHEAERASWSPDSESVVFSSQQEPDRDWRLYRTLGMQLLRVERDGGDIFGRVPNWSADGRIIYWECLMGGCGLHAIRPDGTGLERLTDSEHDTAPAVSPDGNLVSFMSNREGNWEIYVVGTDQTGPNLDEPRRLTTSEGRDGLPAWSPDGRWIAFVSDRGGVWAIWAVRPDGSGERKLLALGGSLEGEVADVPPTEQHGWMWEGIAWVE